MDRSKFYDHLRADPSPMFSSRFTATQVGGIEGILDAFVEYGDGERKTLAYGLATARHEVGSGMVPVREGFARNDAQARRRVNKLARKRGPKSAVAKYAQPAGPYGHVYYGRGIAQETWLHNYANASEVMGHDFVKEPDLMLIPEIASARLFIGLINGDWNGSGRGVGYYLPPCGPDDLRNARRTVNITDKWRVIANYYRSFLAAIDAAGGVPVSKGARA